MEESQREAIFNAGKRAKINLTVEKTIEKDKAICSTVYEGVYYKVEFYNSDCYGSADPFNQAFHKLWRELKEINKDIELKYPHLNNESEQKRSNKNSFDI